MLLTFEQFKTFEPKRETFALFGFPLGHTMSPELHAQLFEATGRKADYIGVSVPPSIFAKRFSSHAKNLPASI